MPAWGREAAVGTQVGMHVEQAGAEAGCWDDVGTCRETGRET